MSLFRTTLLLLALAVLGGLLWQLLASDPGLVLIRLHGRELSSTVPAAVLLGLAALATLWLGFRLLLLPFQGWRRIRRKRAAKRLHDALTAVHEGRPLRAAKLLEKAASQPLVRGPMLVAAARAAREAGNGSEAERLLTDADAAGAGPLVRVERAEQAMRVGEPERAIELLSGIEGALSPRGLLAKARALDLARRADTALTLLPALRSSRALPEAELDDLEHTLTLNALRQADSGDSLAARWNRLTKSKRLDATVCGVFAERMAAFGLDDDAAASVEKSLGHRWSEPLALIYGQLPGGHDPHRLKTAEGWLRAHSESAALALTIARLCAAQRLSARTETYLFRAAAQGAGAEAWEMLAIQLTGRGEEATARVCLENALRIHRGQAPVDLPERELSDRISDEAVSEERDQHGVPRLRGG
ncbi:MAG: heme biosynthesis HemY N-terminal domain-containing protein [Xanthomonadaceae bacterium]|nr:heme biosynthesis HemY N-terminal domain-containing protein [Xanthomonadaceae bacterium]